MKNILASLALAAASITSVLAAPAISLEARQINANGTQAGGVSDIDVLQFALTLEYLEINLYETIVTTFSDQDFVNNGYSKADRYTFLQIIEQELSHIQTLQGAVKQLGGTPVSPCKYNYGKLTGLKQGLNVTDAVNGLGPSAYLGASAYIKSKLLLVQGGAIGNVETRHNSWLNGLIGRSEQPTAYQLPLTPTQAYGVASQFIVDGSCNLNLKAVTAYPPRLSITNEGYPAAPLQPGYKLYLQPSKQINAPRVAFLYRLNTTIVALDKDGSALIPYDCRGQGYAVLTNALQGQVLDDSNSLTTPAALYVDAPAWDYADVKVSTYQFSGVSKIV